MNDVFQFFFERKLLGIARQQMHAFAQFFERVLCLQIGCGDTPLRFLWLRIENEFSGFRLHDDGRNRMPRGIVNVLCDPLAFFERRHFLQLPIGVAQHLVACVQFVVSLRDLAVFPINL